MTRPKAPLPSLRFVVTDGKREMYRLIPQTTPKGRVMRDLWAIPGGRIESTDTLIDLCRQRRWAWQIIGDDGLRRSFWGR